MHNEGDAPPVEYGEDLACIAVRQPEVDDGGGEVLAFKGA
jgi:hypothetical protein